MSVLRGKTFDLGREKHDTDKHKRQHNKHKIERCAQPFGVQAVWTIPHPTGHTIYGPTWTNTTGHTLTYVRARLVAGTHTTDHPHDGCPIHAPGIQVQILLWKDDAGQFDPGNIHAHGLFGVFPPDATRLHISGAPPYHHRDVRETDIFDGNATQGGANGNDGPIILPDQSLSVYTVGVGATFPGADVVVTLWMQVVETTTLISIPTPPSASNDDFADALELVGLHDQAWSDNTTYTTEGSEPGPIAGPNATAWWFWTCPLDGNYSVDTIGSTFDTTLAVFTGSSVGSLTLVASDDDSGGGGTSLLSFVATSGTTYHIQVDGLGPTDVGEIVVSIDFFNPPTNDDFVDAITLADEGGGQFGWAYPDDGGSIFGASKESGEPDHNGDPGGHSVWFAFQPPTTAGWYFECRTIGGSTEYPLFAAYTGAGVGSLTEITYDLASPTTDDFGINKLNSFSATLDSSTTYWLAVDSPGAYFNFHVFAYPV